MSFCSCLDICDDWYSRNCLMLMILVICLKPVKLVHDCHSTLCYVNHNFNWAGSGLWLTCSSHLLAKYQHLVGGNLLECLQYWRILKEPKSHQFLRKIPEVTQKFLHCNLCNCTIFILVSVNVLQELQVYSRSQRCIRCLKPYFDIQHYCEQADVSYPLFFYSCQLELSLEHPKLNKAVNTLGHPWTGALNDMPLKALRQRKWWWAPKLTTGNCSVWKLIGCHCVLVWSVYKFSASLDSLEIIVWTLEWTKRKHDHCLQHYF